MSVKTELKKVYTNRLMQTGDEIIEFEEALSNLMVVGDTSIVGELCMGFDDDTEHHEVMFGLIHGIEYLYKDNIEDGLFLIAQATPGVIDRAREWVEILHYRILNDEQSRRLYGGVLSKLDSETKEIIINLLKDIRSEDLTRISNSVDEVLRG